MQSRPDFQALHVHKEAGMERTIVMGCHPMAGPDAPDGVTPPDWTDGAASADARRRPGRGDPRLRFRETAAAARRDPRRTWRPTREPRRPSPSPTGPASPAWFAVEGTIVGDGRSWDQVRFNAFPSKAAFTAVATDPARLAAQHAHREPAIADTYTLIVRPSLDRLAASV